MVQDTIDFMFNGSVMKAYIKAWISFDTHLQAASGLL
jgi:hypothetical protein